MLNKHSGESAWNKTATGPNKLDVLVEFSVVAVAEAAKRNTELRDVTDDDVAKFVEKKIPEVIRAAAGSGYPTGGTRRGDADLLRADDPNKKGQCTRHTSS